MKPCPEFLDADSPTGLEVYRLAPDESTCSLVYPDVPAFLEDGRRMIMNAESGPQICHLDEQCRCQPLRELAPDIGRFVLASDGRHIVYQAADPGKDQVVFNRLDVRTGQIDAGILGLTGNIPETALPVSMLHCETVSHDATRLAGVIYLDHGQRRDGRYAIWVADTQTGEFRIICAQPHSKTHLRYCPITQPPFCYDLMLQMNHGSRTDENGKVERHLGPPSDLGVDIHIMRDDGTHWRDLPWGRDGEESCIGHQLWRGDDQGAITITLQNMDNSYGWADGSEQHVVAGWPVDADPDAEHAGRKGREDRRAWLSEGFPRPRFCHLAMDASGLKLVLDTFPIFTGTRAGMLVYIADADNERGRLRFQYLLNSGVTFMSKSLGGYHAHPIISPNGREVFFNSNLFGSPAAYMVRNLPWS